MGLHLKMDGLERQRFIERIMHFSRTLEYGFNPCRNYYLETKGQFCLSLRSDGKNFMAEGSINRGACYSRGQDFWIFNTSNYERLSCPLHRQVGVKLRNVNKLSIIDEWRQQLEKVKLTGVYLLVQFVVIPSYPQTKSSPKLVILTNHLHIAQYTYIVPSKNLSVYHLMQLDVQLLYSSPSSIII